ncbi:hypothetical protein [Moorena producens]|uniref:hypothetical protein n=1 Tax=Moorena producens TaxID=1155739 RepID=UPI003C709500
MNYVYCISDRTIDGECDRLFIFLPPFPLTVIAEGYNGERKGRTSSCVQLTIHRECFKM